MMNYIKIIIIYSIIILEKRRILIYRISQGYPSHMDIGQIAIRQLFLQHKNMAIRHILFMS